MKWLLRMAMAFTICGISCTKDAATLDVTKPEIKIIYPLDIPNLIAGQPLCLKSIVKDNFQVTVVHWEIFDNQAKKQVYQEEFRPAGKIFVLEAKYLIPSAWIGGHHVKIFATDLSGNAASAEIPFVVNQ